MENNSKTKPTESGKRTPKIPKIKSQSYIKKLYFYDSKK